MQLDPAMHLTAKPPYTVSSSVGTQGGQQDIFSSIASVYAALLIKKLFPVYMDLQELANMKY